MTENNPTRETAIISGADDESSAPLPVEPQASFWARLRRWFGRGADLERLRRLDEMLAADPFNVSGYVLRGELYLKAGYGSLARQDFQTALELAKHQVARSEWGIVAQGMQDRAQAGLEKIKARTPQGEG